MFGVSWQSLFHTTGVPVLITLIAFLSCRVYPNVRISPPLVGIGELRNFVEAGEGIDPAMKAAREIIDKELWRRECGYRVVIVVVLCFLVADHFGLMHLR